jgi:hypothetical protein
MRRRIFSLATEKRWRFLALLFVVVVSGISIAGYVALSITLNGLPSNESFQGWIALIQPASETQEDKVQLQVESTDESSNNPSVRYTVSACGPRPYSADLLLSGDAQLSDIAKTLIVQPRAKTIIVQPRAKQISLGTTWLYISGNELGRFSFGTYIGSVQLFHLDIAGVSPCSGVSGGQPNNSFPGGADQSISGSISAPLQQNWSGPWGWWHGPHASQSWPLTGGLGPSFGAGLGTIFTFAGLPGRWSLPATEYVEITADDVPATWSIDSSLPTTSAPDVADWSSMTQISPTAQFTDSAGAALIQDWIVISAVGLGIGGGMLATLLWEWIRPREDNLTASKAANADLPGAPVSAMRQIRWRSRSFKTTRWLAVIGMAFFAGYARGQFRRRKS